MPSTKYFLAFCLPGRRLYFLSTLKLEVAQRLPLPNKIEVWLTFMTSQASEQKAFANMAAQIQSFYSPRPLRHPAHPEQMWERKLGWIWPEIGGGAGVIVAATHPSPSCSHCGVQEPRLKA